MGESEIAHLLRSKNEFSRALLKWYHTARRDLPWRAARGTLPEPYHVLVSEAMLQQTQVVTVVPYFHRFLARFPTIQSLAESKEQDVLRLWQGLGYYSRARNLRRAAQMVLAEFSGVIPRIPEELLRLPGVGRYTAGAIASLAHNIPAPILDGNVARVLCRIDRIDTDPRDKATLARLWQRAAELLPAKHPGDFNSALMELGATVCTPRSPNCPACPVRSFCEARQAGEQELLPIKRKRPPSPVHHRTVVCVQHANKWLIRQRPMKGRWAGLWEFVTFETADEAALRQALRRSGSVIGPLAQLARFRHALTHRRYEFEAFVTTAKSFDNGTWVTLDELATYPLPAPHVKLAALLRQLPVPSGDRRKVH